MSISTSLPTIEPTPRGGNQKLAGEPGETRPRRRLFRSHHPRRSANKQITLEGILFIGLAVLIGLVAMNSGANLLYLVLSMMLSMLIVSGVMAGINLRHLTVGRVMPLEFHAGQHVKGLFQLQNGKGLFHSYAIGIRDVITGPAGPGKPREALCLKTFALMVPPRGQVSLPVQITLGARGLYALRQIRIVSRFPFGFFEKIIMLEEPAKLLVYPRLYPVTAVLSQCPRIIGELESERKGLGSSIYGIRDYQSGDPARLIHWKLSAKGQGFKVKEMEQDESRSYRLMLDLRCPAKPPQAVLDHFERAVSVAATLARLLLRQGASVGLWTTIGNVPASTGSRHLQRIMRALAQVQVLAPETPPVVPESGHDVTQVWIEYLTPEQRTANGGPTAVGPTARTQARDHVIDARRLANEVADPETITSDNGETED